MINVTSRAVQAAVNRTRAGTVPPELVQTKGRIEDVWLNAGGTHDTCMSRVADLIRGAKYEVCIQAYIVDCDSQAFDELVAAIREKQRRTPDFTVRFVTTQVSGSALPWHLRGQNLRLSYELERRGIKAEVADFVNPIVTRQSDHTKSFVIDGVIAVVGGDNIDDKAEKDLMVRLTGPVVDGLLADFDHAWLAAYARKKGVERGPDVAPAHRRAAAPASRQPLVPLTILSKEGAALPGQYYRNDADRGLLAAIDAAKTTLKIASPNFNDMYVMEAIARAAARGVQVQVLLPKGYLETASCLDRGSNTDFKQWVAQQPALIRANLTLRWCAGPDGRLAPNHTKYLSVDGEWAYVGSQNMDNQAWRYSRELGVGIADRAAVRKLDAAVFDADWRNGIAPTVTWWDRLVPAINPLRLAIEAVVRWLAE